MLARRDLSNEIKKIEKQIKEEYDKSIRCALKAEVLTLKMLRDQRTNQIALLTAVIDLINGLNLKDDDGKLIRKNRSDYMIEKRNDDERDNKTQNINKE